MSQEICSSVDLIEELRLRRWARENYVPLQSRSGSLHPIILDEMCCRDGELEDSAVECKALAYQVLGISNVALAPNDPMINNNQSEDVVYSMPYVGVVFVR